MSQSFIPVPFPYGQKTFCVVHGGMAGRYHDHCDFWAYSLHKPTHKECQLVTMYIEHPGKVEGSHCIFPPQPENKPGPILFPKVISEQLHEHNHSPIFFPPGKGA